MILRIVGRRLALEPDAADAGARSRPMRPQRVIGERIWSVGLEQVLNVTLIIALAVSAGHGGTSDVSLGGCLILEADSALVLRPLRLDCSSHCNFSLAAMPSTIMREWRLDH